MLLKWTQSISVTHQAPCPKDLMLLKADTWKNKENTTGNRDGCRDYSALEWHFLYRNRLIVANYFPKWMSIYRLKNILAFHRKKHVFDSDFFVMGFDFKFPFTFLSSIFHLRCSKINSLGTGVPSPSSRTVRGITLQVSVLLLSSWHCSEVGNGAILYCTATEIWSQRTKRQKFPCILMGGAKSHRNGWVTSLVTVECFEFLREVGLLVQRMHLFIWAPKVLSHFFFSYTSWSNMKDIIATYKPCLTYVLKIIEAAARYQFVISRSQRLTLG